MESLSILHERISRKLEILNKLAKIEVNTLYQRYNTMSAEYIIANIDIELNNADDNEIQKKRQYILDQYMGFISGENICEKIEEFAKKIFNNANSTMAPLIHDFNQIGSTESFVKINSNKCECGGAFQIRALTSDMICVNCGNIEVIEGTYFDNIDGNRNAPYKPSKHCQNWVYRIFGIERIKIPDDVKEKIKDCMTRDNVKKPNCSLIRQYLKELKITKYNNNIVKIRREITGIGPPTPSDQQIINICMRFAQIDEFYMKIKTKDEKSRRYYPFFIRKAIEIEYSNNVKDKEIILEGIHIQDKSTTEKHDELYEKICEVSNGQLKFTITKPIERIY